MRSLRAIVTAAGLATVSLLSQADESKREDQKDPPLIAYALQLPPDEIYDTGAPARRLRGALFEIERHPPPRGAECSNTLGASRFSAQYMEVAIAREDMGELDAAMEAANAALACTPRDASIYVTIADLHLLQGRIDAARAALVRGAAIDPDDRDIDSLRARVDFLEERWADAAARFRAVMADEVSGELHPYWQLFYWLSQRRAGDRTPELPPGPEKTDTERTDDEDASVNWPAPVLAVLKGEKTEAQIIELLGEPKRAFNRRQWLTEALYYVGELRLAEGDAQLARRYFAAVVNLKVSDYVEYAMARGELARMRRD